MFLVEEEQLFVLLRIACACAWSVTRVCVVTKAEGVVKRALGAVPRGRQDGRSVAKIEQWEAFGYFHVEVANSLFTQAL
jgi:hypothetical protein